MIKWLFARKFYSICSMHNLPGHSCPLCKEGSWRFERMLSIEGLFHRHFYRIWYLWVNRRGAEQRVLPVRKGD